MFLFLPRPPAPSFKSVLLSCFVLFLPPLVPLPPRRGRPDRPVRVNFAGNSPPCRVGRQKEEKKKEHNQSPTPPSPLVSPPNRAQKILTGKKKCCCSTSHVRSYVVEAATHIAREGRRESELPHWYNRPSSLLSPLPTPPPPFSPPKIEFSFVGGGGGGRGRHLREKFFVGGYSSSSSLLSLSENSAGPPPPPTLHLPLTARESLPLPVVGAPLLQFHRWRRGGRGGGGSPPFWKSQPPQGETKRGQSLFPPLLLTHGKRRVHDGPHLSQLTSHESAQRFLSRDGPLRAISIPFPPFLCMNGR